MSVTESSCVLIENENNNAFSVRVHSFGNQNWNIRSVSDNTII